MFSETNGDKMDKKGIIAILVVVVLLVAAVSAYVVINKDSKDNGEPTVLDKAELKVFGNINGDGYIDDRDVAILEDLVKDGKTAAEYPLADANQDGKLDSADVDLIRAVSKGESATIWHINYHDTDGDSVMDTEIVSTKFPIKSTIATGSTNTFLLFAMLGISDELKGASYYNADKVLFGDTYLDTTKVERLGTSSTTIAFEDGKVGSSDIIAKEGVTALISDWNRTYIKNEADFEKAGIDVVRVAAASVNPAVMKHSALLLGLLFQKVDRANEYVELSQKVFDYVNDSIKGVDKKLALASSSDGGISSETSDYTEAIELAGGKFALDNKVDFGGSSSIKIASHPEVYQYKIDVLVHLRTGLAYDQTAESVAKYWSTYTTPFADAPSTMKQYIVSGTVPVCLRVAYAAVALNPDLVSLDKINEFHQQFFDNLFDGKTIDISSLKFFVSAEDMN